MQYEVRFEKLRQDFAHMVGDEQARAVPARPAISFLFPQPGDAGALPSPRPLLRLNNAIEQAV